MMKLITLKRLEAAHYKVVRELKEAGLYTHEMAKTNCVLTYAPAIFVQGYFIQESGPFFEWWGLEEGHIYLPFKIPEADLVQVIRHEYGHALLWHHPEILKKNAFKKVFNFGKHTWDLKWDLYSAISDEEHFITEYARTHWEEDFCETFAFWLKCKGKYKAKKYGTIIDEKMSVMPQLKKMISSLITV